MCKSGSNPTFWHQPAAERALRQALVSGRLPHSVLLTGPDGAGKWAAALWIAQSLLCREKNDGLPCGTCRDCARAQSCSHPDLHLLFPAPGKSRDNSERVDDGSAETASDEYAAEFLESKRADPFAVVKFKRKPTIRLNRIRELIAELNLTSVEGGEKVVIVYSAEQTANDDCQSIMLKTIEEPPPSTHFILTSAAPERLLPTILSRCQTIRFAPVDPSAIAERLISKSGIDPEKAALIAAVCGGGWGNAVRLASEDMQAWYDLMIEFWNGAFRARPYEMLAQIGPAFRAGNKPVGFDLLLQAFDVWAYCLWRDCQALASPNQRQQTGAPIPDLETGWACWRILQNARGSLYVNVGERHAIAAAFLAMRRKLRIST